MGSRICFMVLLLAKRQYDLIFPIHRCNFPSKQQNRKIPVDLKFRPGEVLKLSGGFLFLKELVIFYTTTLKSALCPTIRRKQIRSS
mgnify:CR=1 FL=1